MSSITIQITIKEHRYSHRTHRTYIKPIRTWSIDHIVLVVVLNFKVEVD
jgi:hypothetical protein